MQNDKIWKRDIPRLLKKFYKEAGYQFPKKPEHSLIDLIEWLLRIPSQSPRRVYKSAELQKRILTPFELRGLNEIERLTLMGGNLKPYLGDLSRSIRNRHSRNIDYFWSDWKLLHFHLGVDFENRSVRVSRTKRILVARYEDDAAYFVDLIDHGKGYSDIWVDTSPLSLLQKSWPHILGEPLFESEEVDSRPEISPSDYNKLRMAGINAPVFVNGMIYTALGGGIAVDGSSSEASFIQQRIMEELDKAETLLRKEEPNIDARLVIKNDFSIGFLNRKKDMYYCAYEFQKNNYVTIFIYRLISEIPLFSTKPDQPGRVGNVFLLPTD